MTTNQLSEVGCCNLALSRIGSTQQITSFNDGSNEAAQASLWYPQVRDSLLNDFPWPWTEAYVPLVEVAGPETTEQRANAVWYRSYRYPSDCLKMRRIVRTPYPITTSPPQTTGTVAINYACNQAWRRAVGDAYPVSYALSNDATGRLIVSDQYGPNGLTAVYTQGVTDPTQFSADFVDLLVWRLAVEFAMGLAFSDAKRQWAEKMYLSVKNAARAATMNETQSDIPFVTWQSQMVRARWGSGFGAF